MKEQLKHIEPYKPGKRIEEVQQELGLAKVEKLASNENPFGSSPKALDAVRQVLESSAYYPDGYATELRSAVSRHLNVREDRMIFGNGSDELISLVSRCTLQPGANVVAAWPTFSNYKRNALIDGAEVREIPLKNGEHDLEAMLEAVDERTEIVWLCNPNNPTGTYISENDFIGFLDRLPNTVLVVCDEAYKEYVVADDYPDTIKYIDQFPNLLVTRTFSKAYGLAGFRVGYGVGHEDLIRSLEPAREPFNVSRAAQAAACAAIGDQAFIEATVANTRKGLKQYYDFCEAAGLTYYPSQTNFILIDFGVSGDIVFDYLLKRGFIVRSGTGLGAPTAVRITIGTEEQNTGVIQCLKDFLG